MSEEERDDQAEAWAHQLALENRERYLEWLVAQEQKQAEREDKDGKR